MAVRTRPVATTKTERGPSAGPRRRSRTSRTFQKPLTVIGAIGAIGPAQYIRSIRRLALSATMAGVVFAGCGKRSQPPVAPEGLAYADLQTVLADDEQLAQWRRGALPQRVRRLDVLLDLFDYARFSGASEARQILWAALGGHRSGRGPGATGDAIARLLDEALRIEEAPDYGELPEDAQGLVADVIALLTNDLAAPSSAYELATQQLALRELVTRGHPRVRDNAHWRRYDHIRGTLVGATEARPERREDIAVHALYARRDDLRTLLGEIPATHRPPLPTPDDLLALASAELDALAREARWRALVAQRRAADEELRTTVLARLPAARSPRWPVPQVASGVGRAERRAPVLLVGHDEVTLDAGRPQQRRLRWNAFDVAAVARELKATSATDGRGTVLLALEPELAASSFTALRRAIRRSGLQMLELAVREPHASEPREVVTALPLRVVRDSDSGAGSLALRRARMHIHVSGQGPVIAIDGHTLSQSPATARAWAALVTELRRAYPRERAVVVTLAPDVTPRQLLQPLVALVGGPSPRFEAAAWWAGGPTPTSTGDSGDARLARRLAWRDQSFAVTQPYPLGAHDQARLDEAAAAAASCLPELESGAPDQPIVVSLVAQDHRITEIDLAHRPATPDDRRRTLDCLREHLLGLRFAEHGERFELTLQTRPQ